MTALTPGRLAWGPTSVTAERKRQELSMSVSAPSPATNCVASPRAPAGLPEDCFGAYNESSCRREMGHNALENHLETKSVVARLA